MNATAKWLMCSVSLGLALHPAWSAANTHLLGTGMATAALATSAIDPAELESARLAQAREAMKAGRFDEAERLIAEAAALNVKHDPILARFKETPEKVRRDLEQLRAEGPRTPSSRFSAWPPATVRPEPAQGEQKDPFASRAANDATIDRLTNDAKSRAARYLENGRQAIKQGDLTGAISWHAKARAENAAFAPGEYSPDSLAAELRQAGVDPRALSATTAAAPRFGSQDVPQDGRDLASRLPAYGPQNDPRVAFQDSAVKNLNQVQPERNPLTRGSAEMVHNQTLGAGQVSPLAQARQALAAGDVRRASEFVSQAKASGGNFGSDSAEKVEALIRKSNQLSAGVRPGSDPMQYSRDYATFLMEQSEGLMAYGDLAQAERLAQQAKNVKVRYSETERTPDRLLEQIAVMKRQGAAPAVANDAAGRRLPAVQEGPMPQTLKQEAMQLMAHARLALDRGDVQTAHQLAQQAQSLRVPENEFAAEETRPWQLVLETSKALNHRGPQVIQAGSFVENAAYHQQGGYAVQQGLYDPQNDPSRNLPATASDQPGVPNRLPTVPRTRPVWDGDQATAGIQFYEAGMRAFAAGERDTAHQHFKQAWKYQEQLDPQTRGQLRDKLLALDAPRPQPLPAGEGSPLGQIDQKQEILRQKLSREIQSEEAAVDRMMKDDPEGALARMKQMRERINGSELDAASRKQLLVFVDRKIGDLEGYITRNRAQIDLDNANRQVREGIERDQMQLIETQTKLAELVDQFNRLLDEQRFPEALVVAKQANEIAPREPVTQTLLWKAKFVMEMERQYSIQQRKEAGLLAALGNVEESAIPFDDSRPWQIGDPKEWKDLRDRRKKLLEQNRRRLSPAELEIQAALNKPVEVNFTSRPLAEVMDTLGKMANVNIHLDPQGLHAEGVTSDTPVTLNLSRPIMLRSALNIILDQLRLSYIIQNEVLRITSQQTRDSNLIQVVYNVADLVIPIPNFTPSYSMGLPGMIRDAHQTLGHGGAFAPSGTAPLTFASNNQPGAVNPLALGQMGPSGSMATSRPNQLTSGPGSMGGGVQADFDSLIELITSTVQPNSWKEGGVGEGTIAPFETNLSIVVSQTEEVHKDIADLLEQLRRLQDLQVTIEVRFITLNDNFFERIGIDFDFNIDDNSGSIAILPDDVGPSITVGLGPDGNFTANRDVQFTQNSFSTAIPQFGGFDPSSAANFGFAILSDIEVFFLLQAATGDVRTNILQAPKVTLFNGQQAVVSDTTQRPFVTSVIPVVGDFAAAQQPVIVVLSEGTSLSVQAVVSPDRRFVRLTLVPFFSQIGDVQEFTFTGRTTTNSGTAVVDPTNPGRVLTNDQSTTVEGTTVQLPTFAFTTVTTTVSVPDGGTVLLGGIKRQSEGRTERGVPLLSKVPYVSRLFKNVGIGRTTQSLMMMVTPRIIIQEEEEAKLGIDTDTF